MYRHIIIITSQTSEAVGKTEQTLNMYYSQRNRRCVHDKSNQGLGSMPRYSAQILICFLAYIFHFFYSSVGLVLQIYRTATMHNALCYCPL